MWTESDSRQFSSDNSRQSALDGIRQSQGAPHQRRMQQNIQQRQPTGRRGTFPAGRRGGTQPMRGMQHHQSQPIPRIGGNQGQAAFGQQQQQTPYMQQRPMGGIMSRGSGGYTRGQRSRGRGAPFRGGR